MTVLTIDTEKDSKEHIAHAIDFLRKIVDTQQSDLNITTTHSEPSMFFNNELPSTGQVNKGTSANELLNMFDSDEDEELKPKKELADFSQFMKW